MARHCLTHTKGGSQLASRRQRLNGDCSGSGPVWRVSGMSRLTKAIRLMICAGDRRQTAESAAQRLRTSGWWRPINRDERDAHDAAADREPCTQRCVDAPDRRGSRLAEITPATDPQTLAGALKTIAYPYKAT